MNAFPQAAKTYLERHFESFPSCSLDQLIQHALKSLQVRGCIFFSGCCNALRLETLCEKRPTQEHSFLALQASMSDGELKREAVTVSVVGRGMAFTILDDDVLDSAIAAVNVSPCTLAL